METVNYPRIFLAALVTAAVYAGSEFIIEGIALSLFGISEDRALQGITATLSGTRYHIVNTAYFYGFCCAAMWLYASLIPRYGSLTESAIAAYSFLAFLIFLADVNLVNAGVIPLSAGATIFAFTFLELLAAVFAGAGFYSMKQSADHIE